MSRTSPRSDRRSEEANLPSHFRDFDLLPALERGIEDLGFTEPTPIQAKALPPALEGRDVLAAAMTGSGKTAAFCLPILDYLARSEGRRGAIRALVLTPTRELAAQVEEHLSSLGRHTRVTSTTVFGGVKPGPQERALQRGVDVVVATPGRLLDHMSQPWCSFEDLEILVLDEADRMLDMGFLPDVRRILKQLPEERQTLLFSATLPKPIVELSRQLLHQPVRLDVERQAAPATGVSQTLLPVPEPLKRKLLVELLDREGMETALVFTRTKHRANRLAQYLEKAGVSCDRIHGNRSQKQREKALAAFRNGRLRVLVATDIAARGIDVEELPHVVNFDIPGQAEDYIHRVGRTARARSTGEAWTFVTPANGKELRSIEQAVGERIPQRRLEGFDYSAPADGKLEIPVQERIAAHRAKKAQDRARSAAKKAKPASASRGSAGGSRQGRGQGERQESNQARPNQGRPRRRRRRSGAGSGR